MNSHYSSIRIVIADDHECFREGFKLMMRKGSVHISIVGEAQNGKELFSEVENKKPDVVITDIKMPEMDGFEAARRISISYPNIGIIALSMLEESSVILDMFEAGAKGYLLKNSHIPEIIEAIETVSMGGIHYCSTSSISLVKKIACSKYNYFKTSSLPFNETELKIVKLICKQLTLKEIGDLLHLSLRSIEEYTKKLRDKTDAKNLVGIALYAVKNNIVGLNEI